MHPAGFSPGHPARPTRVMVVDDVALVRGLVDHWIAQEPGFEVVALAADGQEALDKLEGARPDIVLLDVEMPGLDGVRILPAILARRPETRVVMVSTLTRRNAELSLQCLALGAADYLTKPSARRDLVGSVEFRRALVTRLHAFDPRAPEPSSDRAIVSQPPIRAVGSRRRGCILIGASTGGPKAILALATTFGSVANRAPILVAQHMPAAFTAAFAEQIAQVSGLPCAEGRDGERVGPGRVYLAPGGRDMGLDLRAGEATIRLEDGGPDQHCRPAVDTLFRDAARIYGKAAVGIVLTGMGSDGLEGARSLAACGGTVLVQDRTSSAVWGMPGSVARAGLASAELPLAAIPGAIRNSFGIQP